MICSGCRVSISDDCRYCPQCGQPTLLSDHIATVDHTASPLDSDTENTALTRYVPFSSLTEALPAALQTALTQANLCRIRRQWEEAIEYCITVLRAQPGNQSAHALLGDIYRDQGKLEDAIQWYRMAVELRPNPTDADKLQRLERERQRLAHVGDPRLAGGQGLAVALNADGSVTAGTRNLMGLSPRRWLNGLTLLSVAFAMLMVATLIGLRYARKTPSRPIQIAQNPLITPAAAASQNTLPPSLPVAAPASSSGAVTAPPRSRVGTGFRPDESTSGDPPPKSNAQRSTKRSLPPAPVLSIKPLPSLPANTTTERAASIPPAPSHEENGSMALADGMRLAKVRRDEVSGNVFLLVTSSIPSVAALDATAREQMVRNVYRAARAYFAANPESPRLAVYVQAGTDATRGGPTLLIAEIDRTASDLHSPERDPIERLEDALLSLRMADAPTTSAHSSSPDRITFSPPDA